MKFVATINVPGYQPESKPGSEPVEFDDARLAWECLAAQRKRHEDDYPDWNDGEYSEALYDLEILAGFDPDATDEWLETSGVSRNGTGTVLADTPGYDGTHDLGLAYSVSVAIECEHDLTREKTTCGACGRSWCGKCDPTPAARCLFEYDHPAGIND